MRKAIKFAILVLSLALSACAVHPLPEDVTGLSTYYIVRQIRCETREAIIGRIIGFLINDTNLKFGRVDAYSRNVGLALDADHSKMRMFRPDALTGTARRIVDLIWHIGIAYNYNLEMVETNNDDADIDLLRVFSSSHRLFGVSGKFDRQRQNTRAFTITDNFADLVTKTDVYYCTPKFLADENMLYPIAGHIGVDSVIEDFTRLAVFGNLAGDGTKDISKPNGPPTLADQLEFTTLVDISATPKITFSPVVAGLADASLTTEASRRDVHRLTIGLYLPTKGAPSLLATRNSIFGSLLTASGGAAEQGAAQAVNQLLTLKLFRPQITLQ